MGIRNEQTAMLARKKRKKPDPWLVEPEYDNPHVVNITTQRTEPPPRNRFDLTNDNLSALFTVKSPSPPRRHPLPTENDEPTSFAVDMMQHLSGMKIKKKLDFDADCWDPRMTRTVHWVFRTSQMTT